MLEHRAASRLCLGNVVDYNSLPCQGDLAGEVLANPHHAYRTHEIVRQAPAVFDLKSLSHIVCQIDSASVHAGKPGDSLKDVLKNILGLERLAQNFRDVVQKRQLPVLLRYLVVELLAIGHISQHLH